MAFLLAVLVLALGALAIWVIWRVGADRKRLTAWGQRLTQDATLKEWTGTVEVAEPVSSYVGNEPVAYTTCYGAKESWQPDEDLVRAIDQMKVWSRQTRCAPFDLVADDGQRIRVTLDSTSFVHVATKWLGFEVTGKDVMPLPRGESQSLLAGYWEMAVRAGDRIRIFGTPRAVVSSGLYRNAPPPELELDAAVLVCTPELERSTLIERAESPRGGGFLRVLGTAFVMIMVVAALGVTQAV